MTNREIQSLSPGDIISIYLDFTIVEFKLVEKVDNMWKAKRIGSDAFWMFKEKDLVKADLEFSIEESSEEDV